MRIITGKARGLQLTVPKTYDVRPTADRVKESVFNNKAISVCQNGHKGLTGRCDRASGLSLRSENDVWRTELQSVQFDYPIGWR